MVHKLAGEYLDNPDEGFEGNQGLRKFLASSTRRQSADWLLEHMPTSSADAALFQSQGMCTVRDLLLAPTVASSDRAVTASDSFGGYGILNGNHLIDLSLLPTADPRRLANSPADLGVLTSLYCGETKRYHAKREYTQPYRPDNAGFAGRFEGSGQHLDQARPDGENHQLVYTHGKGGMRHTDTHIMKGFFMGELLLLLSATNSY
jgi:hypothetical protein